MGQSSIKVRRNQSVPDDYLEAVFDAINSLGKFESGKMNGEPKKRNIEHRHKISCSA